MAPSGLGRFCSASLASRSCPLEQAEVSQVQSSIPKALLIPRTKPCPCQTITLNPQVFHAGSFHDHTAESWPVSADTATWAGTNDALTEPSQHFMCWPKGKEAGQTAGHSNTPLPAHRVSPGSWLAEQQRFLSRWRVMGRQNTQCLGLSRPYQLWPRSAGRKRVSIPAEPCFRQEPFPLSRGRAGSCRAFDTESSEAGL